MGLNVSVEGKIVSAMCIVVWVHLTGPGLDFTNPSMWQPCSSIVWEPGL